MPTLSSATIFALLGPAFIVIGLLRYRHGSHFRRQARTFMLVGILFSAVAMGLRWQIDALLRKTFALTADLPVC